MLFILVQFHLYGLRLVWRQRFSLELVNFDAIAYRPEQVLQGLVLRVLGVGSGAKSQAEGRQREARQLLIAFAAQVVAFIDHEQAETLAYVFHLQHG